MLVDQSLYLVEFNSERGRQPVFSTPSFTALSEFLGDFKQRVALRVWAMARDYTSTPALVMQCNDDGRWYCHYDTRKFQALAGQLNAIPRLPSERDHVLNSIDPSWAD